MGILIDEVRTRFKVNLFFIILLALKTVFVLKCKIYKELKQNVFFVGCQKNSIVFWFYRRGLLCVL